MKFLLMSDNLSLSIYQFFYLLWIFCIGMFLFSSWSLFYVCLIFSVMSITFSFSSSYFAELLSFFPTRLLLNFFLFPLKVQMWGKTRSSIYKLWTMFINCQTCSTYLWLASNWLSESANVMFFPLFSFCRWYIFEESILCTWTVVLYIDLLSSKIIKDWYDVTLLMAR